MKRIQHKKWLFILVAFLSILGISIILIFKKVLISVEKKPSVGLESNYKQKIFHISGLGKIEPQGGVITVSPTSAIQGIQVKKILVKEGDWIESGQIIAILENYNRLKAVLLQAQTQMAIYQANLDKIKAGSQISEINAQIATIERLKANLQGNIKTQKTNITELEAQLELAISEYKRYEKLYQEGVITTSEFDNKNLRVKIFREQVERAKATLAQMLKTGDYEIQQAKFKLEQIKEVPPVNIAIAEAELRNAKAAIVKAETDLELGLVKSPIEGQVLKIHTFPGEIIGTKGLIEMGQTKNMYVVAEIYEGDINQVKIGQKALIVSEYAGLTEQLGGKVEQIGLKIGKNNILDPQPGSDNDTRVVEIKILLNLEDSKVVRTLTNLLVRVTIEIEQSP
ncbi:MULTISPECIES: ABC exporter membrane fusion protein [unclassified Tolypothrix]|nr:MULTISPECIES: ABC exporter membrane fusion protein [unclassified Tolypothrix]MBE9084890.1 ABC exporter membrane fusion protein [Tolypothrix sp. LEGE 11397]UYD38474.1 ABC exporter membrane fusion protein [Tolypothrix sp. PCC 7601]BAY95500.1 HlyD family secretion protein [Microchaete diplosiphon NIES-3275]